MLKIQVLGKGLIPRGYGIAPKTEPFPADYRLIGDILNNKNLKVNMVSPEDGHLIEVTKSNVRRLWDTYRSDKYVKPANKLVSVPETLIDRNARKARNTQPIPEAPVVATAPAERVTNEFTAADIKNAVNIAFNELKAETAKPTTPVTNNTNTTPKPTDTVKPVDVKNEPKTEEKKPEEKKNDNKSNNNNGQKLKPISND